MAAPEIERNRHRGVGPPPVAAATPKALAFHRRLPGYAPSPFVAAPSIAARLGLEHVSIKDESARLGLPAFKILGASWATYRLLEARHRAATGTALRWDDLADLRRALAVLGPLTLLTATDGNHGRAVAHTARLFGLGARISMPAGTAPARVAAIEAEGATARVIDGTYDDAVALVADLADDRNLIVSDTSWPGYHEVPRWVIEGYETIFAEADDQAAATGLPPIDLLVAQTGVGALAAAMVAHRPPAAAPEPCRVVVEPRTADCTLQSVRAGRLVEVPGPHPSIMAGLNCGRVSEVAWPAIRDGVDVLVTIDDDAAEDAVRSLDRLGITAGETGASGLAGLEALCSVPGARPSGVRHALIISTERATDPVGWARIVGRPAEPVLPGKPHA